MQTARTRGELRWDRDAYALWERLYSDMAAERDDLVGSLTARAEAQTLRLSLLYALLDGATEVRAEHLRAAYAVWSYCAQSVDYIFGAADPVRRHAERILLELRARDGMTRTAISDLLYHKVNAKDIDAALELLNAHSLAKSERHPTAGRPLEIWRAC
ncbi:MAG: hypothetical protein EB084_24580 [Proteobacteria bacterium]|nr:hypothetical protein [Pseudomonadota bacterium]